MPDGRCTCPSLDDVFAPHVQIGTLPPCPVHPEPDFEALGIKLLPRIEEPLNIEPLGEAPDAA